jgi:apolipoprotein N-acyltransferase
LLAALATGALLFACYFPLDWGWIGWVALVPLLTLVRASGSRKRIFFCAWAGGLAFFVPVLQWMRVAHPAMYATWLALAAYCALYVPAGVLLLRSLDRRTRLPLVVTVPVVWVALEFLRSHLATGFSWYLLAHTQHDFLPVIQITDLGGAYTVTALVAAVNALIFEVLYARPWFRSLFALPETRLPSRRALLVQGVAVALLLAGGIAYGECRLLQNQFSEGPRVALVQSNLSLALKNEVTQGAQAAQEGMEAHQVRLTNIAAAHRPDLIVWPETSWPGDWIEVLPEDGGRPVPVVVDDDMKALMARVVGEWKTALVPGVSTQVYKDGKPFRRYNSAILIWPDGTLDGRYDKIHRVPFGEYIPLRDWLPFMNWFSPYDFDYSITPGDGLTRFHLGSYDFGVLICYEDTVSDLARQYALPGGRPAADFLLNTSNDGWFDGTAEHAQHLAICRFRAIEARRTIARCVNMGISAVVDPNGRVLAPQRSEQVGDVRVWQVGPGAADLPPRRWGEFKKVPGVLIADLPIDDRISLYARAGDWLPWGCWLVVGAALVVGLLRGRRAETAPAN